MKQPWHRLIPIAPLAAGLTLVSCAKKDAEHVVEVEAAPVEAVEVQAAVAIDITEATFKEEVEEAPGLVLVDFWAPWCGPCRFIDPILAELAKEYAGQVKLTKVNVDHNQELAARFDARRIPMVILYKDGKPIDAKLGAHPKSAYEAWIQEHLETNDSEP